MDTSDMKKKTIINNNVYIPPEIIEEEILGKVSSVKDLLAFRSVCKSWKTLIDSDNFKKKHFQLTAKSSLLLIWRKIAILPPTTLQMFNLGQFLDFSQLPPHNNNNNNNNNNNLGPFLKLCSDTMMMITLPDDIQQERRRLYQKFGAVNGLVCLSFNFDFHVVWNPSTKQYKIFNAPVVQNDLFQLFFYSKYFIFNFLFADEVCAFGFDPISQDYKFLMATFRLKDNNEMRVLYWLYSLRNNSWKYDDAIKEFPFTDNLVHGDGYMDDGKFYWFAKYCRATNGPALIVFDFCTEAFDWMPLPEELATVNEAVAVANFRGLELLTTFVDEVRCEVWQMQNNSNDGSSSSWSRKYTVDLSSTAGVLRWRPVGLLKGGEMMFQGRIVVYPFNREVVLIHPHTLAYTYLGVAAEDIQAFNFVKSLFSVNL